MGIITTKACMLNLQILTSGFWRFTLVLVFMLFFADGYGQILRKVGHALGKVGEAAVRTVTAPTETAIKVAGTAVGANKPEDILDPIKRAAAATGNATEYAAKVAVEPQRELTAKAGEFAKRFGRPGEFIFNISTFSQSFYNELGYTSTITVGSILKGQNPLVLTAAPLAASITQPRNNIKIAQVHYRTMY